jgi:hypothetical protein
MLALDMLPLLEEEARARQLASLKGEKFPVSPILEQREYTEAEREADRKLISLREYDEAAQEADRKLLRFV